MRNLQSALRRRLLPSWRRLIRQREIGSPNLGQWMGFNDQPVVGGIHVTSVLLLTNGSNHQSFQLLGQIFRCIPDDVLVLLCVEVHVVLVIRIHTPNDG